MKTPQHKCINLTMLILKKGDNMDKKTEELMKKCESGGTDVMESCKVLLEMMDKKDLKLDPNENYLSMAENIKRKDIPKVLEMALKIRESGDIKDTELKNAASVLIRAIEMS